MKKRVSTLNSSAWFPVIGILIIGSILLYNLCMVLCGRCNMIEFFIVPWLGWVLIGINLTAATTLLMLRRTRRSNQPLTASCPNCRIRLREGWSFCPSCGSMCPN